MYISVGFVSPPESKAVWPPFVFQLDRTIGGFMSRSTGPPETFARAGYTDRSSVTRNINHVPSGLNLGDETPRSKSSEALKRVGAALPSAATNDRCSMLYAPYFLSSPSMKAIHFPSGLHS